MFLFFKPYTVFERFVMELHQEAVSTQTDPNAKTKTREARFGQKVNGFNKCFKECATDEFR